MPSRNEGSRIFIGNLPPDARERDLEKFFSRFGKIRNMFIKNGKYGFCSQQRTFRVYVGGLPAAAKVSDLEHVFRRFRRRFDVMLKERFGFLEFDDYRDADDAVYEMNGKELLGERITVEHARGPRRSRDSRGGAGRNSRAGWVDKYGPPERTDYRVIVENLSSRVSWQDLKDLMRRAGEVTYANAHKDKKNEGVVEFATRRDMERAIEKYDDYELHGRKMKIVKGRGDRRRSRSRSRSRSSRSRSRSRSRSHSRSRSKSEEEDRDEKHKRRRHSGSAKKARDSRSRSKSPKAKKKRSSGSKSPGDKRSSRSKSPRDDKRSSRSKSPRDDKRSSRSKSPGDKRSSRSKSPRDKRSSRSKSPRDDEKRSSRSKSPREDEMRNSSKSRSRSKSPGGESNKRSLNGDEVGFDQERHGQGQNKRVRRESEQGAEEGGEELQLQNGEETAEQTLPEDGQPSDHEEKSQMIGDED